MARQEDEMKIETPEARRAFVLARAGNTCEYRTRGCVGVATRLLVDGGWTAYGIDGAPTFAIRAVCQVCHDVWAR
jgi:hypothetical protein